MSIEWLPRGPSGGNGWDGARASAEAEPPHLVRTDAEVAVLVPGLRRQVAEGPVVAAVLAAFFGPILSVIGLTSDSPWSGVVCLGASGLGIAGSVWFAAFERRSPDVVLSPAGVRTGGVTVPWSSVEGVVTYRAWGPRWRTLGRRVSSPGRLDRWNYLALRVGDFDNVLGLSPFRAGLANLTRRRLVILCESGETADPGRLVETLEHLVTHPAARRLLSDQEGVRLLTVGPPRRR